MYRFDEILKKRVKLRSNAKDFTFIYEPNQQLPTAFVDEKYLVYDMRGTQVGVVSKDGFFCKMSDLGRPVAFYDGTYDSICDSQGNVVACVESAIHPYFALQRPTFPFDVNCCRVYSQMLPSSTCNNICSGKLSSNKFLSLF